MKYCTYCGSQIDDTTLFCPNCGSKQNAENNSGDSSFFEQNAFGNQGGAPRTFLANDPLVTERSTAITVLSFIFPIIGLILWLVWKDTKPGKSISAAKGGLAGFCFNMPLAGLIFWIVWKDTNPELAKPCGIAAIVGFIFGFISGIAMSVLMILGMMNDPDLYASLLGTFLTL